eukprot:252008_1
MDESEEDLLNTLLNNNESQQQQSDEKKQEHNNHKNDNVISNNNKNIDLTNPELKLTNYSHINLIKGRPTINYSYRSGKSINEWEEHEHYVNGDVVCVDPKGDRSWGHIHSFKLWSLCINDHISNKSNKPKKK